MFTKGAVEKGKYSFGQTGKISEVGFGAFRIEAGEPAHKEALRQALSSGINLIDTCAIYSNGQSERCIGEVMQELVREGVLEREDVCLVSKVGQLQDELYERVLNSGAPDAVPPELVVLQEGHYALCIHPAFIEQQLTESLERLQLDYLDTYLLHNPENYLLWAKHQGIEREIAHKEFERRIRQAFVQLEQEVQNGRIKSYGLSSNTFHVPADAYEFTSLERIWEIAESVADEPALSMIQFPMNLLETGGMTEKNHPGDTSVVSYAKQKGLTVVVNRPFDAFLENLWIRLTDVHTEVGQEPPVVVPLIDELNELEEDILEALPLPLAQRKKVSLGIFLQQYWQDCSSTVHWQQVWDSFYAQKFEEIAFNIDAETGETGATGDWSARYRNQVQHIGAAISGYYQFGDAKRITAIKQALAEVQPDLASGKTLTQSVIRALRSTDGIDCVLVGMRKSLYVEDVLTELRQPVVAKATEAEWDKLRASMHRAVRGVS